MGPLSLGPYVSGELDQVDFKIVGLKPPPLPR
jgi:hypothetical protein